MRRTRSPSSAPPCSAGTCRRLPSGGCMASLLSGPFRKAASEALRGSVSIPSLACMFANPVPPAREPPLAMLIPHHFFCRQLPCFPLMFQGEVLFGTGDGGLFQSVRPIILFLLSARRHWFGWLPGPPYLLPFWEVPGFFSGANPRFSSALSQPARSSWACDLRFPGRNFRAGAGCMTPLPKSSIVD